MDKKVWQPLQMEKLDKIVSLFSGIYSEEEYGDLAARISSYWLDRLKTSWERKPARLKELDLSYDPSDPLSRVEQAVTVIAYADSVQCSDKPSLEALDDFLSRWFPAVGGLHILPACRVVEDRFNDGYFSQVVRDGIHPSFGSDEQFAAIMHKYFSMNDIVLGHVDIENPVFRAYLDGDDQAGRKFFVFTDDEYRRLKAEGAFDNIFRPRPFPLFTIFRRQPSNYRETTVEQRVSAMYDLIEGETGQKPDRRLISILYLFSKIKNDQMLLSSDYALIEDFLVFADENGIDRDRLFQLSKTQEVEHDPWIFTDLITDRASLLKLCGYDEQEASAVARVFESRNEEVFGEEIRALTTFSHVQVDVSTASFEGLKALADDLCWYLQMDLNMLRLDAVNYAFKKWGTSCFGLPELDRLMEIVYLSMECISPRMIPNLEVNDSLTTVLTQMSSESGAPPMMHDFHLASLLPAVFHSAEPKIIDRIFKMIAAYDIPGDSIRFSLSESHDGKSVRGSMDLLTYRERMILTAAVVDNGGYVKYKSVPKRRCLRDDFIRFCSESEADFDEAVSAVFDADNNGDLILKDEFQSIDKLISALASVPPFASEPDSAAFYFSRLLDGREPYELCISTRDSLPRLEDGRLEADRFLAFESLAFAVMGRNVKTVYFNDLLALPNDYEKVRKTGELRNIKRTKIRLEEIERVLRQPESFEGILARGMNRLIAVVSADPALNYRGGEAKLASVGGCPHVAAVWNECGGRRSCTVVNLTGSSADAVVDAPGGVYTDSIAGGEYPAAGGKLRFHLPPFGRLWLSAEVIDIADERLYD